ncbi:hypothetical protein [Pseudoduganella violacea]|uniref:Uncharacterized protein n=1 Tax=Pseudoduganella violacea TaxID=1715466 RepID=A0A7W5FVG4_9BURK|nr:hypothetical protein [Pseudoduganella violacea]MBB3120772.1 hypothetical protein [Pseudoduganella violacea]
MDKPILTSREASTGAGFNKLPILRAIIYPFKINELRIAFALNQSRSQALENLFFTAHLGAQQTLEPFDKNTSED